MKTLILSLAIFSSVIISAQSADDPAASSGAAADSHAVYATSPAFNKTNTVVPWQASAAAVPARLTRLLADLQEDLETTLPSLATFNDNLERTPQAPAPNSGVIQYEGGNGALPAKDLSTLVSQNLSANLGQNLSRSLAVPTSLPWSTWGNGPGMVLANVGGAVVATPILPARTAWDNAQGVVVTTPGGGVFTLMPGLPAAAPSAVDAKVSREVTRQLTIVQNDLERLLRQLQTMNATPSVAPPAAAPSSTPASPPVYLTPTGRR